MNKKRDIEIVPTIIPQSLADIKEHVERLGGKAGRVQLDVMDGKFSPEPSWPYASESQSKEFRSFAADKGIEKLGVDIEVDMLVKNPELSIKDWVDAGASGIIIHVDSTDEVGDAIQAVRTNGTEVGLALKPHLHINLIEPFMQDIDFVQIMGNDKVGFHGVALDEGVYGKISRLRESYPELTIAVDIGVDDTTAPKLIEAGANKLASGSFIFGSDDIDEAIHTLKGE